ncbi:MAG: hypothetical protein J7L34_04535 [Thermotogaceae bacterium]|nr:hypothetical protein [Thermotogaceae bacterium]
MHEKLYSAGVIADKSHAEFISKVILDGAFLEPLPTDFMDKLDEPFYGESLKMLDSIFKSVGEKPLVKPEEVPIPVPLKPGEVKDLIGDLDKKIKEISESEKKILEELNVLKENMEALSVFYSSEFKLSDLEFLKYTKVTFGRVHSEFYLRLEKSLKDTTSLLIDVTEKEGRKYFVLIYEISQKEKIQSILKEVSAKIYDMPDADLTPKEAYDEFYDRCRVLELKVKELDLKKKEIFYNRYHEIMRLYNIIFVLKSIYDFLKNASATSEFIVIRGWVTQKGLEKLKELERSGIAYIFENIKVKEKKPTLLRNPRFFKPFEMLVKMYGIPRSDEIDPTPIIGTLFVFFYGLMFGDIGHGLIISFLSYLLYRKTRGDLWYIMSIAGISSAFFGLLYGSVFGFEVIKPLFARPMDNIFLFLTISVVIGAFMVIGGMIMNVINRLIRNEKKQLLFDPNGLAGMGFYIILVTNIFWQIYYKSPLIPWKVATGILAGFVVLIYLYFVLFEEGTLGEKMVLGFFETYDRLLSYLSNTLSFVRLGAFAMNHAGLFLAFYILAKMSSNPAGSFLSLLIGNLLLIFLEGLVVFIQAIRLEFYEFFSKFYSGDGKEFKAITYDQEVK